MISTSYPEERGGEITYDLMEDKAPTYLND